MFYTPRPKGIVRLLIYQSSVITCYGLSYLDIEYCRTVILYRYMALRRDPSEGERSLFEMADGGSCI